MPFYSFGRKSDGTLLATGKILLTGAATKITVSTSTPSVTFTVTSLTADIYAKAGSAFTISEDLTNWGTAWVTAGSTYAGSLDNDRNCFQVPTNIKTGNTAPTPTSISAKLKITGLTDTGVNILMDDTNYVNPDASTSDFITFTPYTVTGFTTPATLTVDDDDVTPTTSDPLTSGEIGFSFETGAIEGFYRITFNIPVKGFGEGLTWYIRGGTGKGKTDFDGGKEEGILLLVTDAPQTLTTVTINPNYPANQ